MAKSKQQAAPALIADNRKARYDYKIEQTFEAGLVLEGWEVKSLRAGKAQLRDSYVIIKRGEAWLIGAHFSPPKTIATYTDPDSQRARKLLLQQRELKKIIGAIQRQGYTVIALNLHWKKGFAKVDIALVKGKKQYDKREATKQRDWQRDKQRLVKTKNLR